MNALSCSIFFARILEQLVLNSGQRQTEAWKLAAPEIMFMNDIHVLLLEACVKRPNGMWENALQS